MTTPTRELVSERVQWIVIVLVWIGLGLVGVGQWMGLLP